VISIRQSITAGIEPSLCPSTHRFAVTSDYRERGKGGVSRITGRGEKAVSPGLPGEGKRRCLPDYRERGKTVSPGVAQEHRVVHLLANYETVKLGRWF